MKLLEIATQIPPLLYHFTQRKFLPSIKSEGIKPAKSKWPGIEYENVTFVTTKLNKEVMNEILTMFSNKHGSPEDHERWNDEDWSRFKKSYVVLTIDSSKIPDLTLKSDPNAPDYWHAATTSTSIPPEAIKKISDVKFDWS